MPCSVRRRRWGCLYKKANVKKTSERTWELVRKLYGTSGFWDRLVGRDDPPLWAFAEIGNRPSESFWQNTIDISILNLFVKWSL